MEKVNVNCNTMRDFDTIDDYLEGHLLINHTYIMNTFVDSNLLDSITIKPPTDIFKTYLFEDLYDRTGFTSYSNFNLHSWDDYKENFNSTDSKSVYNYLVDIIKGIINDSKHINLKTVYTKEYLLTRHKDSILKLKLKSVSGINNTIRLIHSYYEMLHDVETLNIKNTDLHNENIGIENGKFKVFDIMDITIPYLGDCPTYTINEEITRFLKSI